MLLLIPRLAFACPACFAASNPGGLRAYYLSTVLLSTMPFVMIGAIAAVGYTVRRRASQASRMKVRQSSRVAAESREPNIPGG